MIFAPDSSVKHHLELIKSLRGIFPAAYGGVVDCNNLLVDMEKRQLVYSGNGEIRQLEHLLKINSSKNIFLVTGKESYISSGAKNDIESVLSGYQVSRYTDYSSNPTFEEALAGAKLYLDRSCDFVVAIGGGSAIDVAKAINVLQAHEGQELEIATGIKKVSNKLAPLCAIPTTAGTGSEATHFAVIYISGVKYSLTSQAILPDYVVLDASYTSGLSSYITACTGFDALSQAIESYWSKGSTEVSRKYAVEAIMLLKGYIEEAVNIKSIKSRHAMLRGAYFSGKAINISKTTAPHALSYAITSKMGLPHGHAVALTLGNFIVINSWYVNLSKLLSIIGVDKPDDARMWWYDLMSKCGLIFDLKELGIVNQDCILELVKLVNSERLDNHPFKIHEEDLIKSFKL